MSVHRAPAVPPRHPSHNSRRCAAAFSTLQKRLDDISLGQPVAILGEHRRHPDGIIRIQPDEPAEASDNLAIGMFLTTLSFLITTPNSWAVVDGFFIPAGGGFFILKDLVLLGAALWTAADAISARTRRAF